MGSPEAGGLGGEQQSMDWNFKTLLALECVLRSL